ncbi:MAG: hypothetical protein JXR97_14590 [Planctomycetes bacterium]|nr:hypothetical protein [Planctomycetota bacterium]
MRLAIFIFISSIPFWGSSFCFGASSDVKPSFFESNLDAIIDTSKKKISGLIIYRAPEDDVELSPSVNASFSFSKYDFIKLSEGAYAAVLESTLKKMTDDGLKEGMLLSISGYLKKYSFGRDYRDGGILFKYILSTKSIEIASDIHANKDKFDANDYAEKDISNIVKTYDKIMDKRFFFTVPFSALNHMPSSIAEYSGVASDKWMEISHSAPDGLPRIFMPSDLSTVNVRRIGRLAKDTPVTVFGRVSVCYSDNYDSAPAFTVDAATYDEAKAPDSNETAVDIKPDSPAADGEYRLVSKRSLLRKPDDFIQKRCAIRFVYRGMKKMPDEIIPKLFKVKPAGTPYILESSGNFFDRIDGEIHVFVVIENIDDKNIEPLKKLENGDTVILSCFMSDLSQDKYLLLAEKAEPLPAPGAANK